MKLKKLLFYTILTIILLVNITPALASTLGGKITIEDTEGGIRVKSDVEARGAQKAHTQEIEELPSSFDLRNVDGKNYVTPVQNQMPWNNCWAFSALGAVESNALMNGAEDGNFSERALTWFTYQKQSRPGSNEQEGLYLTDPTNNPNLPYIIGGESYTVISQLSAWNGASTQAEAPYQNDEGYKTEYSGIPCYSPKGTWSLPYNSIYDNAYHLQNATYIETNYDFSNENVAGYTNQVKQKLMSNGAVSLSFAMEYDTPYYNKETNAQYIPVKTNSNHAVTIVGWDDTYPIANFNPENLPSAPGAWICKNSWSDMWGDDGYFYLSYYDQGIREFDFFEVEVPETGYSYENNYEYDLTGNKLGLSSVVNDNLSKFYNEIGGDPEDVKVANVYTANNDQIIRAFSASTYIETPTQITTEIYLLNDGYQNPQDGKLVQTQVDQISSQGFHTFDLTEPVELESGQIFSIVQNIVYSNVALDGQEVPELAGFPIEYGLTAPVVLSAQQDGVTYQVSLNDDVKVNPGQSYFTGINSEGELDPDQWFDLSNQAIRNSLGANISSYFNSDSPIMALPGNAMIKVYTTNVNTSDETPAESISINDGLTNLYLATTAAGPNATTSIDLTAKLEPAEANSPITWVTSSSSIASISSTKGETVTVRAISEGKAIISAISGNAVANLIITITNEKTVCDSVVLSSVSPDFFIVTANNVQVNPALNLKDQKIEQVSMFAWSEKNQGDINAKVAQPVDGTNDWQWQGFAINDNKSYMMDADHIIIHVYGSTEADKNGDLMQIAYYSWVNPYEGNELVTYTTYSQNLGFSHPPVTDGFVSGITDQNLHMEGLRISSNIIGVSIDSTVHVQNLGWLETQPDGIYNGTMHRNLGIEAVKLTLSGQNARNYQLTYRVLPENGDWTQWGIAGTEAGSTGQNVQLRAIQVRLIPLYMPLS